MKIAATIVLALALSACTMMPDRQVIGPAGEPFPVLRVIPHRVSMGEAISECWRDTPVIHKLLLNVRTGCARIRFDLSTCEYWAATDNDERHEQEHCAGQDHGGVLQAAYERWLAWLATPDGQAWTNRATRP